MIQYFLTFMILLLMIIGADSFNQKAEAESPRTLSQVQVHTQFPAR